MAYGFAILCLLFKVIC